jgi:uncharacterized protein
MADQDNNQGGGRGFAGMPKDKQREIASKGGKASHEGDSRGGNTSGGNSEDNRGGGNESK